MKTLDSTFKENNNLNTQGNIDDFTKKIIHTDAESDWHRAYKMIELENQLINHRVTALLALQGFLFAGLAVGVSNLTSGDFTRNMAIVFVVFVFSIIGIISTNIIYPGIEAALWQIRASALWLLKRNELPFNHKLKNYPPIIGKPRCKDYIEEGFEDQDIDKIKLYDDLNVGVHKIPKVILMPIWGVILSFNLLFAIYIFLQNK